jgi:hypothetical protein
MDKFSTLGKTALRAACKEAGISYGKLTVDGMRDALRNHNAAYNPHTADSFEMTQEELNQQQVRQPVVADPLTMSYEEVRNSLCPCCGIQLDNGLLTRNDEAANKPGVTLHMEGMTKEYECMGCGGQFGDEVAPYVKPVATDRHTGSGLKIEKNREERNGVKRPSAGGKCREIWDFLDALYEDDGTGNSGDRIMPTAKMVREEAVSQGWNPNNASIEFYQWRKFNGITGRSK